MWHLNLGTGVPRCAYLTAVEIQAVALQFENVYVILQGKVQERKNGKNSPEKERLKLQDRKILEKANGDRIQMEGGGLARREDPPLVTNNGRGRHACVRGRKLTRCRLLAGICRGGRRGVRGAQRCVRQL